MVATQRGRKMGKSALIVLHAGLEPDPMSTTLMGQTQKTAALCAREFTSGRIELQTGHTRASVSPAVHTSLTWDLLSEPRSWRSSRAAQFAQTGLEDTKLPTALSKASHGANRVNSQMVMDSPVEKCTTDFCMVPKLPTATPLSLYTPGEEEAVIPRLSDSHGEGSVMEGLTPSRPMVTYQAL